MKNEVFGAMARLAESIATGADTTHNKEKLTALALWSIANTLEEIKRIVDKAERTGWGAGE